MMNPEWLEAPESPVQIQRPVNVQQGRLNQNERLRNSRLSLNRRGNQLIDLSSPTNESDNRRKRKSPPSVISIPGSSNLESRSSKKGKNVVQEADVERFRGLTFRDNKGKGKLDVHPYNGGLEVERFRGLTFRDNKGKGKLDVRPYNGGLEGISHDQPGLNSPPRRVGQRLLVRSSITSPSNNTRRNVAFNHRGTGLNLDALKVGGEHNSRPAVRDNKGKGKIDGNASNVVIQEISPDQSSSSVLTRPIRQRYLVRNGVIAPRNIAERTAASNNGSTKEGESAPMRSELEADQQLALQPPSAVMLHESVGLGPQPAGSSYVGSAEENAVLSQIVADDSFGGVFRSRREIGAPSTSNASSSRSTQNNRRGRLNQTSTLSARHNPAVSAASINITARPFSGASSSTYRTGAIGAYPQRSRIGSLPSINHAVSSSMIGNLETQATVTGRARGRIIPGQGVVHGPIIDVDEIRSPDFVSAARAQQLAYDEMIARQLQEELYNEVPGVWSMEELDARIAISIQQEENAMHAPIHRTSFRTVRSSRSVASSSRRRNNVLTDGGLDEHDYEALLALDENNFRHTGASISQINSLPESIVKSCNLDETCAVCLETPSIGEKIRHLPCLHKFHKDCIDMWLQRKKECPICKCSTFLS